MPPLSQTPRGARARRPNAAPDNANAAVGATVDKDMKNPEAGSVLKVGWISALQHHKQSQHAKRRLCQRPSFFAPDVRRLGGNLTKKVAPDAVDPNTSGIARHPLAQIDADEGCWLELRDSALPQSCAMRLLERMCGGLRGRVGAVANFLSTDRAALMRAQSHGAGPVGC